MAQFFWLTVYMRHNYYLTRKLCSYSYKNASIAGYLARYAYAYRYLFMFAAAETPPETVWIVRETKLKHVSVWP